MVKKEAEARTNQENSCGITSVNLGIVGFLFSLIVPFLGITLGIAGLVFGYRQHKIAKNKWASWGMGLSLISIALSIFLYMLVKLNPSLFNV